MDMLPEGYQIRSPEQVDYRSMLETLKTLTKVGDVTEEQFAETIAHWATAKVPIIARGQAGARKEEINAYNPLVITDENGRVVATGNIILEAKLVHNCGLVGHIEDIAVAADQQGKHLGQLLISKLAEIGKNAGCYKIILDCSPHNLAFYEKCGFTKGGLEMQIRY